MKLQSLGIVFAIIILPMVIILTYYVQMQVDTIALQTSYDSKLQKATHDAMSAFEINTANEDLSAVSDSLRTIIEASNNIFFNTLATNFGLSNASKSSIEPYIPAILYTLYDGYYIYSPTEQPIIKKYGYKYEPVNGVNTEEAMDSSQIGNEISSKVGQPIYTETGELQYLTRTGTGNNQFTTDLSSDEVLYVQQNILKSYMPYSARYVRAEDDIDITVNYTLDNYINIEGTIKDVYYTKTGYLINENILYQIFENENTDIKSKLLNYNENVAEDYILKNENPIKIILNVNVNNEQKTVVLRTSGDGESIADKKEKLTKFYEEYQDLYNAYRNKATDADSTEDEINLAKDNVLDKLNTIQDLEYKIQQSEAVAYYVRSTIFSKWVYNNLGDIRECDIDTSTINENERTLSTTLQKYINSSDEEHQNLYKNVFDKFSNKEGNVFARGQDIDGDSVFASHKAQVIRNSIQYNLNVAFSSYSAMANGKLTFEVPLMTDDEWEKITTKVSVVAYMQGVSCGSKNYSNYALVSSTNNELTVIPDEIYYVPKAYFNKSDFNKEDFLDPNFTDDKLYYHRIDCPELTDETEYIAFTSKEVKYDKIYNKQSKKYEYDHKNLSCYNCIINRNYIRDNNDEESYVEGIDFSSISNSTDKLKAYYQALGALRQGIYKTNALTKSEGYCSNDTEKHAGISFGLGFATLDSGIRTKELKRPISEVKGIKLILSNLKSNDVRETAVNFKVYLNNKLIGQKTLATSNYSRNQTIELDVNPDLFMGEQNKNINIRLERGFTTSIITFNQEFLGIIYK